jgi:hypothetical protein
MPLRPFEVWVDYADATHLGRVSSKPSVLVTTCDTFEDAEQAVTDLAAVEGESRRLAADLGQPHYDASFSVWKVETVRAQVLPPPASVSVPDAEVPVVPSKAWLVTYDDQDGPNVRGIFSSADAGKEALADVFDDYVISSQGVVVPTYGAGDDVFYKRVIPYVIDQEQA